MLFLGRRWLAQVLHRHAVPEQQLRLQLVPCCHAPQQCLLHVYPAVGWCAHWQPAHSAQALAAASSSALLRQSCCQSSPPTRPASWSKWCEDKSGWAMSQPKCCSSCSVQMTLKRMHTVVNGPGCAPGPALLMAPICRCILWACHAQTCRLKPTHLATTLENVIQSRDTSPYRLANSGAPSVRAQWLGKRRSWSCSCSAAPQLLCRRTIVLAGQAAPMRALRAAWFAVQTHVH